MTEKSKVEQLLDMGVKMPLPGTVAIGDEVDTQRISGDNVTLHPGTRITGAKTLVMPGTVLGQEGPVTLDDCFVGPKTRLKGGFFQGAVFAGNNSFGSGAHVRSGTILEEQASAAHTVGLKQTLLFPFVTLGSLINFCDCFMAGGTSRKDHSEVGSSFIHFNYTPNQDKATPSMFGNVCQGVMLNNHPVFLGGQGGVVGPCRLAFGSLTAAGTICRKDEERPDRLILGGALKERSMPKKIGVYLDVKRIFRNNCRYIAGMIALLNWYRQVRRLFPDDDLARHLHSGMEETLEVIIGERIERVEGFRGSLEQSKEQLLARSKGEKTDLVASHESIINQWPVIREKLALETAKKNPDHGLDRLVSAVERGIASHGNDYIPVIRGLDPGDSHAGSLWLETIEQRILQVCNIF
ncbi:MAG: protein GlmU [Desulfobacteraceae bacterium]